MLIDYHAHVNFGAFKDDAEAVIKRALDSGVFMILVGTQIDTSRRAVEMASMHKTGVWASVGLHPIHLEKTERDEEESHFISRAEVFDPAAYRALAQHEKVAAIGECGLDYWHIVDAQTPPILPLARGGKISPPLGGGVRVGPEWVQEVKARQHRTFRQHLDLADELDLPLILHCRGSVGDPEDAYRDMLVILREYVEGGKIKRRGSIHCFVSTWDIAQDFLGLGFHIGFTGVITFVKSGVGPYDEVVRNVPLERILVETDCPYLAPVPMRGKRNEPLYVRYVAEKVAEIKGMNRMDVKKQLFENTLRVFYKISSP
ncbi:TatD family hydrolase [Candidatus Uhrbacteria bacterium]|nr:TatD family hydrolase [Candidatus Uhrbacteria bacterium]